MCPGVPADMSDEDSINCAVKTVSEKIGAGGLNLLINNAAIARPPMPGKLCDTSKQDMMDVYDTNVVGPFLLTKVGVVLKGPRNPPLLVVFLRAPSWDTSLRFDSVGLMVSCERRRDPD